MMITDITPVRSLPGQLPRGHSHTLRTAVQAPAGEHLANTVAFCIRRAISSSTQRRKLQQKGTRKWTSWPGSTRPAAAINVLEHPFYERWSAGELSADELGRYAGEYRHAVLALAQASARAAERAGAAHRAGLRRHAEEEAAHVALWEQFERAAGGRAAASPSVRAGSGAAPLAQTRACVAGVERGRGPARAPRGAVCDRGRPAGDLRARSWRA